MTREEYLKFVQSSEAFQALDPDFKQKILDAPDERRNSYIQLLQAANEELLKAKKEFVLGTEDALNTMKQETKKTQKEFIVTIENALHAKEEYDAEKLLEAA